MRLPLVLAAFLALPLAAQPASTSANASVSDRETWAPTAQGVRLLGGHASASAFVDDFAGVSLEPVVGRFVADGLALSLRLGVHASRSSYTNVEFVDGAFIEAEERSLTYGLAFGPSVTKYFGRAGAAVYPFVGVGAFGHVSRSTRETDGRQIAAGSSRYLAGSARVGVMVPVARNVSIEAQLVGGLYDLSPRVRGDLGFSAGIATFLY